MCIPSVVFGESLQGVDTRDVSIFVTAIIASLVLSFLYKEPKTVLRKSSYELDSLPDEQQRRKNSLTEAELSLMRTVP